MSLEKLSSPAPSLPMPSTNTPAASGGRRPRSRRGARPRPAGGASTCSHRAVGEVGQRRGDLLERPQPVEVAQADQQRLPAPGAAQAGHQAGALAGRHRVLLGAQTLQSAGPGPARAAAAARRARRTSASAEERAAGEDPAEQRLVALQRSPAMNAASAGIGRGLAPDGASASARARPSCGSATRGGGRTECAQRSWLPSVVRGGAGGSVEQGGPVNPSSPAPRPLAAAPSLVDGAGAAEAPGPERARCASAQDPARPRAVVLGGRRRRAAVAPRPGPGVAGLRAAGAADADRPRLALRGHVHASPSWSGCASRTRSALEVQQRRGCAPARASWSPARRWCAATVAVPPLLLEQRIELVEVELELPRDPADPRRRPQAGAAASPASSPPCRWARPPAAAASAHCSATAGEVDDPRLAALRLVRVTAPSLQFVDAVTGDRATAADAVFELERDGAIWRASLGGELGERHASRLTASRPPRRARPDVTLELQRLQPKDFVAFAPEAAAGGPGPAGLRHDAISRRRRDRASSARRRIDLTMGAGDDRGARPGAGADRDQAGRAARRRSTPGWTGGADRAAAARRRRLHAGRQPARWRWSMASSRPTSSSTPRSSTSARCCSCGRPPSPAAPATGSRPTSPAGQFAALTFQIDERGARPGQPGARRHVRLHRRPGPLSRHHSRRRPASPARPRSPATACVQARAPAGPARSTSTAAR